MSLIASSHHPERPLRVPLSFLLLILLASVPATAGAQVSFSGASGSGNFGPQPIGETSAAMTLTFNISSGTTVGSIGVLTTGTPNLDFANASGTTCTATTYSATTNCTVNVTFNPQAAGLRLGAVVFTDSSSNVLATAYISGIGVAPLVTFGTSTSGGYAPSSYAASSQSILGSGFDGPNGVTVDASGNIFVADGGHNVIKEIVAVNGSIPASPTIKTLGSGFNWPYGVAVDGAGNVFVGDRGNDAVKEILAADGYTTIKTLGSGFGGPNGVAVDGSGNVFVADWNNKAVYEILAAGGYTTTKTLATGFEADYPVVDGSGNVYVADFVNGVKEILAAGGYTTVKTLVSGLGCTSSVVPDPAGNLYVTDWCEGVLREVLAAGGYTTVKILASGFYIPNSLTLDGNGNVIVSDQGNSRVVKLEYADPPSLSFASTLVGVTSSDSPQTVQVENIGNQSLALTGLSYPTNFPEESGGTDPCTASTFLGAGGVCDLNVEFIPQSAGALSGNVTLTDNALNVSGAQQSIAVSGAGTPPAPIFTLSQTAVAFGLQELNMRSAGQTVLLTNTGSARLNFYGVLTGANASMFMKWSTCTGGLAPGASCIIHAYFTPTATGPANAALTFTDNASGSPHSLALSGTGTTSQPAVTLSLTSISFGEQPLNTTSAAQSLTMTNSGGSNLEYYGQLTGANASSFSKWSTCNTGSLAPGAYCTIHVYFTPTATGPANAFLTITDNAGDSPQSIVLSGTGTTSQPAATFSVTSVSFRQSVSEHHQYSPESDAHQ